MIRLSIPWLFETIEAADAVLGLPDEVDYDAAWFPLYDLMFKIRKLYESKEMSPFLRISKQKYFELMSSLREAIEKINKHEATKTFMLKYNIQSLKPILVAELNVLPSFLVTGKEGYDVNLLIESGEVLFPIPLVSRAPETVRDAKEAGRALAFELATACGFHTFRVTESVTRRYWDAVAKTDRPKLLTIGNFAAELEKLKCGSPKVWEALKQLSRLHRNPTIHPEVILSVEEAIAILGIARSVIGLMLEVLPDCSDTDEQAQSSLANIFATN